MLTGASGALGASYGSPYIAVDGSYYSRPSEQASSSVSLRSVVRYQVFLFSSVACAIKVGWMIVSHHLSPVCREPSATNSSSPLKSQEITGIPSLLLYWQFPIKYQFSIFSYVIGALPCLYPRNFDTFALCRGCN